MRGHRPGTGVLLLAAVGCAGPGGPHGDLRFAAEQAVSEATTFGATPMFLVTASGERVLSWVAEPVGGGPSRLYVRLPDGALGVLADSLGGVEPHGEAPPRLAAGPNSELYALYTVGREVPNARFPVSALRFARSPNLGRTWETPVTVNEGETFGSHNFHSLLAGPDGAVYAAWLHSVRGESQVWLRRSKDGGRSWEPSKALHAENTCPCCRTALALGPDGALYAAWRKVFPGDVRDVVVARSPDGGDTWDAPVRPREDGWVYSGCPHAGPSLAVDASGRMHIGWWTGKEGEAGVYYARSNDGGHSFAAQPIAVDRTSRPSHVQVAVAGSGAVVISWDDGMAEVPAVLLRTSVDGGTHFGDAVRASAPGSAATFPVLGTFGDSVLVAWSQTGAMPEGHGGKDAHADRTARVPLPTVGQSEIRMRAGTLKR